MDFDVRDLSPLDTAKYFTMWFVSGGAIIVGFYFMELFERKEWPILLFLAAAVLGGWHYAIVQGWRLPGF